jgi:hypothetical protein
VNNGASASTPVPPASNPTPSSTGLVAVLSKDLFFGMRIRTSLRQLGYSVAIAQDAATFSRHLSNGDQCACLGIVDFNFPVDWEQVTQAMEIGVPILAFGPHKDVEGFKAAKRAGVTRVVANGEFSRSLPDLAKRYATTTRETS